MDNVIFTELSYLFISLIGVSSLIYFALSLRYRLILKEYNLTEDGFSAVGKESDAISSPIPDSGVNNNDIFNLNDRKLMIYNKFLDNDVRNIIVSKEKILAIRKNMSVEDTVNYMTVHNISQCPVFDRSIDDIMGVVKLKKLMGVYLVDSDRSKPIFSVENVIESPPFISGDISIKEAMQAMIEKNTKLAVIIDEYAQTIGFVTMQNIVKGIMNELNN